jgi:hypothetical protein
MPDEHDADPRNRRVGVRRRHQRGDGDAEVFESVFTELRDDWRGLLQPGIA